MHTRWIETEFDNTVPPFTAAAGAAEAPAERDDRRGRGRRQAPGGHPPRRLRREYDHRGTRRPQAEPAAAAAPRRGAAVGGDALTRPMQGTIVKIAVADGDTVAEGDLVVVLEAMKMEQPLHAHKAGTVSGLTAEVGAVITAGAPICTIA